MSENDPPLGRVGTIERGGAGVSGCQARQLTLAYRSRSRR